MRIQTSLFDEDKEPLQPPAYVRADGSIAIKTNSGCLILTGGETVGYWAKETTYRRGIKNAKRVFRKGETITLTF